ncbi:MAG: acyl carrier protein [Ruminococcaceae bacterium]|nr:acyl carrier protein [Oscillospiraceae bacterium]
MILEKIIDLVAEQFGINPNSLSSETDFFATLGADSLDIVELTMAVEDAFAIPEADGEDIRHIVNIGDLAEYVEKVLEKQ